MKKGDIRKQEIMQTAEALFCRQGFEQTSVQDILDQLKISKGSFYHHFVSKESLLMAICSARAGDSLALTLSTFDAAWPVSEKLDHLLTGMIPFRSEKLSFLQMLLPIFASPEGFSLKVSYCESLSAAYHASVADILSLGLKDGSVFCGDPDVYADILLSMINRLWTAQCDILIACESRHEEADLSELLSLADQYRYAAEKLLSLSYGSLVLYDLSALKDLLARIHIHHS